MKITELNGKAIKKALGAKSCCYRWHNKNLTGGNFGINVLAVNGNDWQICGEYDNFGNVRNLRFGRIFSVCLRMPETEFNAFMNSINEITSKVKVMEDEKRI